EAAIRADLARARIRAFEELAHLDDGILALSVTEGLRALMARLPDGEDTDTAILLTAAPAVFVPAPIRRKAGKSAIAPRLPHSQAEDRPTTLTGTPPTRAQIAALDAYRVSVSDHGLNASTLAARVAASTRAGYTSAVLAALGALK